MDPWVEVRPRPGPIRWKCPYIRPGVLLSSALWTWLVVLNFLAALLTRNVDASNLALLSGTLRTFQTHACDGDPLNIKCPHGTIVSIQYAQYGRQAATLHLCPASTAAEASKEDGNTSCSATQTLQYKLFQAVIQACLEKRQCKILTSPQALGEDPCPGIRKYIEVAYKCRPVQFSSKVVCEGDQLQLSCRKGSRIAVFSASFGRSQHGSIECPQPEGIPEEECEASYSTEAVMRICHGKRKCTMNADIQTFGNPCVERTRRFLKVVNTCVPTKILKPMYQGGADDGEEDDSEDGEEELVDHQPPPTDQDYIDGENHYDADKESPTKPPKGKKKADYTKPGSHPLSPSSDPLTRLVSDSPASSVEVTTAELDDQATTVNCTVVVPPATPESSRDITIAVITEWITAYNFIKENTEKLILYATLSVFAGLVAFLLVVVVRLMVQKRRERRRAKLNISEPLPNGFGDDGSDLDQDITDLSQTSPPHHPPRVEVVSYTSRSTMRRQDSDTNPRAPIARTQHNNYYYS